MITARQIKQALKEPAPKIDKRDQALAELAQHKGWQILRGIIEDMIKTTKPNIKEGDRLETVAVKYMVNDVLTNYLKRIIEVVETTYDTVKQRDI